MRIDLNADLGEGVTDDEGLMTVVGAQVSYRDREHFGRKHMDVAADVLTEWVAEQVEALRQIAASSGIEVAYLKPHGALYNRLVDDEDQAAAVLRGSGRLPVLGLPGSAVLRLAEAAGRTGVPEGFPDRGYTSEGRLVPREQPGALVERAHDIAAKAVGMARAGAVQSLCVHGDSPGAAAAAVVVRDALVEAG